MADELQPPLDYEQWFELLDEQPPDIQMPTQVELDFERSMVIDDVIVEGAEKTKEDFLEYFIRPLKSSTNFQQVLDNLHELSRSLSSLGFISHVAVQLEHTPGHFNDDDDQTENNEDDNIIIPPLRTRAFMTVKEKKRGYSFKLNLRNGADYSSAAGELTATLQNIFGRGESASVAVQGDHRTNLGFNIAYRKPLVSGRTYGSAGELAFECAGDRVDFGATRPFTERRVLFSSSLQMTPRHLARWETVFRRTELKDPNDASLSVSTRKNAGLSTKNALQYTYSLDRRDLKCFPTSGYLLEATTEVAGLFGDVHHFKQTLKAQQHVSFPLKWSSRPVTASFLAQVGFLLPFIRGRQQPSSRLNDRFFLGGAADFHGFDYDGVGERDHKCALGSEAFLCATADVRFPLSEPIPQWIYGHVFGTVGTTIGQTRMIDRSNIQQTLRDNIRASFGVGAVFALLGEVRTELNVCFAHRTRSYDKPVNWELAFFPNWK